ncbi:cobalamin B12-binding domain-containing protein [Streptomyces odontomachi]|uniref:cobalamin B12-binding domain-containing protein n=1 Tax=Streptomyces odontomachi TaxID=2944940 RepID=UPI002108685E|nr:cobalamin-dependent protein [Streptomyces sp. ODS25]
MSASDAPDTPGPPDTPGTSGTPNAPDRTSSASERLAVARDALWDALRDSDERRACRVAVAALDDGVPVEDALLEVVAPLQRRVGLEWAADRITVAQEHAATAVADQVVTAIMAHPAATDGPAAHGGERGRITVCCVDGEWHALPARLLAEVLRLHGWRIHYLGGQLPLPNLVADVYRTDPHAVALSCSLPVRLPTAHAAITACQATGVPVFVGGAAFGADGRYARLLGADAWAPDARAAAARLAEGLPEPHGPGRPRPVDGRAAAAHHEYLDLTRDAPELVRATHTELMEQARTVEVLPEPHLPEVAADIARVVDYLAASLYCDDADLFTDFIRWAAAVQATRGIPADYLVALLDTLATRLHDFPETMRLIGAAHALPDLTTDV